VASGDGVGNRWHRAVLAALIVTVLLAGVIVARRSEDGSSEGKTGGRASEKEVSTSGASDGSTTDASADATALLTDAPQPTLQPTSTSGAQPGTGASDEAPPDATPSILALPSGPLERFANGLMLPMGPPGAPDDEKTGPRVVLKEGGLYRLWYEAVPGPNQASVGYATSTDGVSWQKQGIVITPSAGWEGGPNGEVSPQSILVENGVYRLWYHSYDGAKRRIGYAESSDGISWTKYADPVLSVGPPGAWDDQAVVEPRVLAVDGGYRMYYGAHHSTGRDAYRLGLATSPDGISWTKSAAGPVFGDDGGEPILDAGAGIIADASGWHMWFGLAQLQSINYASSPDGISWTPGPSNPVLTPNPDSAAADHQGVGDSVSVYRDGATYRIMYTGASFSYPLQPGRIEAICIAFVRDPNA
jgi:predicted GH43/DUF377 family glycosyl hydrolase